MTLQIIIILGVLLFLGMILALLRRNALSLKYALLWILTAAAMLAMGIFPQILTRVAGGLGFEVPSNALFTLLLGFVIIILLQQTSTISRQSDKIKALAQASALLEKRVRELEEHRC